MALVQSFQAFSFSRPVPSSLELMREVAEMFIDISTGQIQKASVKFQPRESHLFAHYVEMLETRKPELEAILHQTANLPPFVSLSIEWTAYPSLRVHVWISENFSVVSKAETFEHLLPSPLFRPGGGFLETHPITEWDIKLLVYRYPEFSPLGPLGPNLARLVEMIVPGHNNNNRRAELFTRIFSEYVPRERLNPAYTFSLDCTGTLVVTETPTTSQGRLAFVYEADLRNAQALKKVKLNHHHLQQQLEPQQLEPQQLEPQQQQQDPLQLEPPQQQLEPPQQKLSGRPHSSDDDDDDDDDEGFTIADLLRRNLRNPGNNKNNKNNNNIVIRKRKRSLSSSGSSSSESSSPSQGPDGGNLQKGPDGDVTKSKRFEEAKKRAILDDDDEYSMAIVFADDEESENQY